MKNILRKLSFAPLLFLSIVNAALPVIENPCPGSKELLKGLPVFWSPNSVQIETSAKYYGSYKVGYFSKDLYQASYSPKQVISIEAVTHDTGAGIASFCKYEIQNRLFGEDHGTSYEALFVNLSSSTCKAINSNKLIGFSCSSKKK